MVFNDAVKERSAASYIETMLRIVMNVEESLESIAEVAEEAAERVVAGGSLYSTEDGGGFVSEIGGRAGGLMMIKRLEDPSDAQCGDVVLAGTLHLKPEEQAEQFHELVQKGVLVVLFGSSESPLRSEANRFVESFLPLGTAPLIRIGEAEQRICPAATVGNIAAAWAFLGEFVGACTRRGKMPTMYQSVFVPNYEVRNAKYSGQVFHDDFDILPLEARSVGRAYLSDVKRCFEGIRSTQLGLFEAAGKLAAEAIKSGHKAWCSFMGHHLPSQIGLPGDPGLFSIDPKSSGAFAQGDIFLWVGYYHLPQDQLDMVREAGVRSVWVNGAREIHPIGLTPDRIVIDPYWTYVDASVSVPGYDIRILPPSGVVQTACLWMLAGETAQALAE